MGADMTYTIIESRSTPEPQNHHLIVLLAVVLKVLECLVRDNRRKNLGSTGFMKHSKNLQE